MGEIDVDGLLERMPRSLFLEWMAFYALEPFGDERADLRIALLAKMYADAHRGKGKPPAKLEDFLLFRRKPENLNKRIMAAFKKRIVHAKHKPSR